MATTREAIKLDSKKIGTGRFEIGILFDDMSWEKYESSDSQFHDDIQAHDWDCDDADEMLESALISYMASIAEPADELRLLEHLETQRALTDKETARLEELYFILGI